MSKENIDNWKNLLYNPKLGEILLQHKKISLEQFDIGMKKHLEEKIPLGEILVNLGFISPDELVQVLQLQDNIDNVLSESVEELERTLE